VPLLSWWATTRPARSLARLLDGERVDGSLHRDPEFATTVKLRVIGHQQQLLRIDFERAPRHDVLAAKLDEYERLVDAADACGAFRLWQGRARARGQDDRLARAHGKPVLVDPKGSEYERYRGATLLTPNRSEFREVAGRWKDEDDLERRAQEAARPARPRGPDRHAERGGHVALHRVRELARAHARARGLRL
jgi:bifunctional ADP-heptose synthase (sugar kinase/adenylyltransferase)